MQKHILSMGKISQSSNFSQRIDSSVFRGLGNRDNTGLGHVLVCHQRNMRRNQFRRELAIWSGNHNEARLGKFLHRSRLVHIDVGGLGAKNCFIGFDHALQSQHISACSRHQEQTSGAVSKQRCHFILNGLSVFFFAIAMPVAAISLLHSFQDQGVGT